MEICDGEDIWQWPWLEIRLNAFRWSTIPQKELIIEVLISKVLIDSNISHDEFVLINNELKEFYDMKEEYQKFQ